MITLSFTFVGAAMVVSFWSARVLLELVKSNLLLKVAPACDPNKCCMFVEQRAIKNRSRCIA